MIQELGLLKHRYMYMKKEGSGIVHPLDLGYNGYHKNKNKAKNSVVVQNIGSLTSFGEGPEFVKNVG
jgi:hypothetical protein